MGWDPQGLAIGEQSGGSGLRVGGFTFPDLASLRTGQTCPGPEKPIKEKMEDISTKRKDHLGLQI